ncbi:MAG: glycosyl hydrolase 115 family protein [Prevotellaceae bacterium]|nr:glycosyl hydrolase 115 family protein [Prevotellaceae bacterium]
MRKILLLLALSFCTAATKAKDFRIPKGRNVKILVSETNAPVVRTALSILEKDIRTVLGSETQLTEGSGAHDADIIVTTDTATGPRQAFSLRVTKNGQLHVCGSDAHGTAYGLMEISRLMGVSPWEWWADAKPRPLKVFRLSDTFETRQSPSVEYRGIFINDEDWGLMPWSSSTMEPENERGVIGPKTNERIFELMLRLRANTYWPAMHECTVPFFLTEGNRETAARYGIYIGGSHCEPMACSAAGEWSRRGKGDYDYVNNAAEVRRFWEDRLKEVKNQEILYTIGMRGVHDGHMQGAKTVEEQKNVLKRVFNDQRAMLTKHIGTTDIPQVFIPYKEILDVYNAGLQVPDDVTLMWCDDNYGYIRHFPTAEEKARRGGNGVYYHVSYWGRPHDYLWLGTFSPALLFQQMSRAYESGIQKIWILNVGDIKPAEYQIELFMDMAWNMDAVKRQGVENHCAAFLAREFGKSASRRLIPLMKEHYRLSFIRKPEFMGGTRTEEADRARWNTVSDMPWSRKYVDQRISDYEHIEAEAERIWKTIPARSADCFFQLVKYPIQAAAEMNKKFLYAQLARHAEADSATRTGDVLSAHELWTMSDAAYDSIAALTQQYNQGFDNGGKWNGIMDMKPRKLSVFERVPHISPVTPHPAGDTAASIGFNGMEDKSGTAIPCEWLGYECKAALLAKDKAATYEFKSSQKSHLLMNLTDSAEITLHFLPVHATDGNLSVAISMDGSAPVITDFATKGRSEEWKQNVLSNEAVRSVRLPYPAHRKKHTVSVLPLSEGIVLDRMEVNF